MPPITESSLSASPSVAAAIGQFTGWSFRLLGGTSEPFGVVFDGAEGGAVAETAVNHGVDSEEVRHGGGEEASI